MHAVTYYNGTPTMYSGLYKIALLKMNKMLIIVKNADYLDY